MRKGEMGKSAFTSLVSLGCFVYVFYSHFLITKAICIRETEILFREESKQSFFNNCGSLVSLQRGQGGF